MISFRPRTKLEQEDQLVALFYTLDPVSRWMLLAMARRLAEGASRFGEWKMTGRNYVHEAAEELIDGMHYMLARIYQMEQNTKQ